MAYIKVWSVERKNIGRIRFNLFINLEIHGILCQNELSFFSDGRCALIFFPVHSKNKES